MLEDEGRQLPCGEADKLRDGFLPQVCAWKEGHASCPRPPVAENTGTGRTGNGTGSHPVKRSRSCGRQPEAGQAKLEGVCVCKRPLGRIDQATSPIHTHKSPPRTHPSSSRAGIPFGCRLSLARLVSSLLFAPYGETWQEAGARVRSTSELLRVGVESGN